MVLHEDESPQKESAVFLHSIHSHWGQEIKCVGRECACESVCFHALGLLCQSSNPVAAYGERPVKDQTRTLSAAAGGWYIYILYAIGYIHSLHVNLIQWLTWEVLGSMLKVCYHYMFQYNVIGLGRGGWILLLTVLLHCYKAIAIVIWYDNLWTVVLCWRGTNIYTICSCLN